MGRANVSGRSALTRQAALAVRYVEPYSLAARLGLRALLAGSGFCARGALG